MLVTVLIKPPRRRAKVSALGARRRSVAVLMALVVLIALVVTACGSDSTDSSDLSAPDESATVTSELDDSRAATSAGSFQIEVWADNWMAVYVDGKLIGEDSVSIDVERSFNAETFRFDATYPFTVAIEAKDFKETDSGIEYIGKPNQQMGDGGLIAQITDLSTGSVVSVTNDTWSTLVIHRAPLNPSCANDAAPDATCKFESSEAPDGWTNQNFDDSSWVPATVWSAAAVQPKDGYTKIAWDQNAELVWGSDLEIDNTILLRTKVDG